MQMKKLLTLLALLGTAAVTSAQVTFTALDGKAGFNASEGYASLFDGTPQKWCTNVSGAWFLFKASESVILSGYTLVTGNDNASNTGRNPRTWIIYGINANSQPEKNDAGWEEILSVTDSDDPGLNDRNYEAYHFSISANAKSYNYYKVEIGSVYSGSNVQLSEFIPETKFSKVNVSASGVTYAGGTGNLGQPYDKAVDNNTGSNWLAYTWDGNWILFDTNSSETILKTYALTSVSDASSFPNRTPVSWTWYGSNKSDGQPGKDDGSWVRITKVERDLTLFNRKTSKDRQVYSISDSNTPYRYYKYEINECDPEGTEDLGGQWGGMFGLSEIEINPSCEHTYYSYSLNYLSINDENVFQQVNICDKCNQTNVGSYSGITIKDGKTFHCLLPLSGVNFTYSRSISSDMGTICLPYKLDISTKAENAAYYVLGKYDEVSDVLYFDEVTTTLSPYTPAIYVRKNSTKTLNLDATGTDVQESTNNNPSVNAARSDGWAMVGTIKSGSANESSNSIYYVNDGGFKRCNGTINYKPYRAYITGPEDASLVKGFGISDDMEDAINSIMSTENGEIQLYDLSGRKVSKVRNGEIYIMNGRKVMFNK